MMQACPKKINRFYPTEKKISTMTAKIFKAALGNSVAFPFNKEPSHYT